MGACSRCGEDNPGYARFCLACGRPLAEAGPGGARKPVTVVFADVVGSTVLGQARDPEAVRGLMLRYFEVMEAVLVRHGGVVEKFVGDAVMAVFGLPLVHEDDALRAVRAAADMGMELAALNAELEPVWGVGLGMRTGVNSGEVIAGAPGQATLVTGDAVNLAARLEQAAAPGQVLLGPATYGLVRDAVVATQGPPVALKGIAEEVRPWVLEEVIAGAPGHARRFDTPFVGREHERGLLEWVFARVARERTCHLVTVLGAAGVGKTRLVDEFVAGLGASAKVVSGRCLPYGEGITFWPVAEIVRQAADVDEADPADVARDKLRAALGSSESAGRVADELAGLIGLAQPCAGDPAWAVRKGLEALAAHRPVVIVIDDLHWGEPTLLDLIEHVADWSRDAPILVLAVGRPELLDRRAGWGGGKVNATSLLLEPFDDDDAGALLDALAPPAGLGTDIRRRLVHTAGGNPLFLEELLAMLADHGHLDATGELDVARLPLPDSIQALLSARLDSVEAPERDSLDRASVVGEVFEQATVVALTPPEHRAAVPDRLRTLVRKELLRIDRAVDEEVFAFRHLLLRDAVYAALPKQARAELHEELADQLTATADTRTPDHAELVGYHLEQAVRHRVELSPADPAIADLAARAGRQLAISGRRALARGDMPAAASFLRRAADLLPAGDADRAVLLTDLGKALTESGDTTGATKVLDEAAAAAGDGAAQIRVRLARLQLASNVDLAGWADAAIDEAERAIPVLSEVGDDLGLTQAWMLLGEVRYLRGSMAASEDAFRRYGEHAARVGRAHEQGETAAALAWTAVEGPLPIAEGIARCEEFLQRFAGQSPVEARVWRALAVLRAMRGERDEARTLVARSIQAFADLGQRYWLAATDDVAGRVARLCGDRAGAERALRSSLERLEHIGDATYLPLVLASLSIVLDDAHAAEAAELVARARTTAEPDDVMAQTLWRLADAQRLRRAGELTTAVAVAGEAVERVGRTDLLDVHGDALATLGRLEHATGDLASAEHHLRAALGRYERKGNLVSTEPVRRQLAALASARGA